MDRARKACVTTCPNLVIESKKCAKSWDLLEQRVMFGVLFCEETLYVLVDLFVKILTRTHKKDIYDTVFKN